ncbi:MAG: Mur ligase family protein, partial [Acidobacteriota bacterium]
MDAIEYLYGLEFHGHKFGLENIRAILSGLGDPQRAFRSVIVAGTNGKGSVCAMTAAALTAAGHRTGRYTSPHLIRLEERVAIDGVEVDRLELDEALGRARTAIDGLLSVGRLRAQPTFFEVVTATAFEIFRHRRVEVAVLEVGLGGRLDATNVVSPVAGAITTIDLEHQRYLGDTLAQIAADKAGIVKPGLPVVCGERKPEAVNVIAAICRAKDAELILAWEGVDLIAADAGGQSAITVRTPTRAYPPCTLGLAGSHQIQNALVAVRLLETLDAA